MFMPQAYYPEFSPYNKMSEGKCGAEISDTAPVSVSLSMVLNHSDSEQCVSLLC